MRANGDQAAMDRVFRNGGKEIGFKFFFFHGKGIILQIEQFLIEKRMKDN